MDVLSRMPRASDSSARLMAEVCPACRTYLTGPDGILPYGLTPVLHVIPYSLNGWTDDEAMYLNRLRLFLDPMMTMTDSWRAVRVTTLKPSDSPVIGTWSMVDVQELRSVLAVRWDWSHPVSTGGKLRLISVIRERFPACCPGQATQAEPAPESAPEGTLHPWQYAALRSLRINVKAP